MRYHTRISMFSLCCLLGWVVFHLSALAMDNENTPVSAVRNLSSQGKYVQLPQPPLLDFSALGENDYVKIVIYNAQHQFATDAALSGTDIKKQPIFGTRVYINGKNSQNHPLGFLLSDFLKGLCQGSPIKTKRNLPSTFIIMD